MMKVHSLIDKTSKNFIKVYITLKLFPNRIFL